jgi:hypothetical protein
MTGKEIRRLEIDELLAYADTGEDERVQAALELLRRRQAKQLRRQSKLKPKPEPQEHSLESVCP